MDCKLIKKHKEVKNEIELMDLQAVEELGTNTLIRAIQNVKELQK